MTAKKSPTATAATAPKKRGRPRKNPLPTVVQASQASENFSELSALFDEPIKVTPLVDQSWEDLYHKALNVYQLPVTKEFTKDDLIAAISRKKDGRRVDVPLDAKTFGNVIPPGWAKVHLYKNNSSTSKGANRPQYFGVNGYRCYVPFGLDILIPLKILEALRNAVESKRVEEQIAGSTQSGYKTVEVPRFPFNLLGMTDGPDPRPMMEKTKQASYAPRAEYHELFGVWPSKEQVQSAIKDGIIAARHLRPR